MILFDLSEVLISGLAGVERELGPRLGLSAEATLTLFAGEALQELFRGRLTEDQFLSPIAERFHDAISLADLKNVIRRNFHVRVEGMEVLLERLLEKRCCALVSDHAREWVEYLLPIHPWLARFSARFFSFEHGNVKQRPETFRHVLAVLGIAAQDCLFIDDNPVNVAVAASLGLDAICFEHAEQLSRQLTRRGLLGGSTGGIGQ